MSARARSAKRRRSPGWGTWGAIGIAVIAPAALIATNLVRRASLPGEGFGNQGNTHIAAVDAPHPAYNSDPPTSGWHVGRLASWGSYDYVLPDELLLHNLEDGGVILYYTLGTTEENRRTMDELREVARGYRRTVIAPRESMETPFTLVAWQRLQRFDMIEPEALRAFLDAFEGIDRH